MSKPLPELGINVAQRKSSSPQTKRNSGYVTASTPMPPHVSEWDAATVAVWLRGVEKVPRSVLEHLMTDGVDGRRLQCMTDAELERAGVETLGMRVGILQSVRRLDKLQERLRTSPLAMLGAQLLEAGRRRETEPLAMVAGMATALTTALHAIDQQPPSDLSTYNALRAKLLALAADALGAVATSEDCSPRNQDLMRSCERFVKQMLPILQDLRSQYNAEFPDITDDCVQVITLQRSSDGDLGLDLVAGDDGLVAVRSLAPGSAAEHGGLFRTGDELIAVNGLVIVGWRVKSIMALTKQVAGPLNFLVRLSRRELDRRVSSLMDHARALRDTIFVTSRRSSLGTASNDYGSSPRSISPASARRSSFRRLSLSASHRGSTYALANAAASIAESTAESAAPIDVLQPEMGHVWPQGSNQTIEWQTAKQHKSTPLRLVLVTQGTASHDVIAENVLNSGSFVWRVPDEMPLRRDYRILIESEPDAAIRGISAPFEVDVALNRWNTGVEDDMDSLRRVKLPKLRTVFLVPDASGTLGFEVDGHFISDILPEGPAAHRNGLQIGDQIVEVNGRSVHGWSHLGIINLLHEHGDALELCVVNNLEGYKTFLEGFEDLHEEYRQLLVCRQVEIPADGDDTGTHGLALISSQNVVILGSVLPDTPAASCKHLRPSTCIVHINGQPTFGAKSSEALLFLERSRQHTVKLVVTQDRKQFGAYVQRVVALRLQCLVPQDDILKLQSSRLQQQLDFQNRHAERRDTLPDGDVPPVSSRSSGVSHGDKGRDSPGSFGPQRGVLVRTLSFNGADSDAESGEGRTIDLRVACPTIKKPESEGWLIKLGGSGLTPKNWRKRWFVLMNNTVYYYKTPSDAMALGAFYLPGYRVMPPKPGKRMHNKHGFMVKKEGQRAYYLCAETAEDMKRWMNAMSLASIEYTKSQEDEQIERSYQEKLDHALHLSPRRSLGRARSSSDFSTIESDIGGYDNIDGKSSPSSFASTERHEVVARANASKMSTLERFVHLRPPAERDAGSRASEC